MQSFSSFPEVVAGQKFTIIISNWFIKARNISNAVSLSSKQIW